jgi:hypothetical protein
MRTALRIGIWLVGEVVVLVLLAFAAVELTNRGYASGPITRFRPWATRLVSFSLSALPAVLAQVAVYVVDGALFRWPRAGAEAREANGLDSSDRGR